MDGRQSSAKGQMYRGMGDGFSRAFELALVPAIFGLAGYWLDQRLGVLPVLTIVAVLLAVVGLAARTWYGYDAQMRRLEAEGPWARRAGEHPSTDDAGRG